MRKIFFSVLVTAILGVAAGCGSGSSGGSTPVGVPTGGSGNTLSVAVDGGPIAGVNYQDAAFASAKICVPSSSTCVTVDHLLVDTGSVGVRVLSSALGTLALPVETDGSGNNVNDCVQFADTSYIWGQVESADVTLGGEVASDIPIHVIADPTGFSIPSTCNTGGPDEDQLGSATTTGLGANGILGIGSEPVDCLACDPNFSSTPIEGTYYLCSASACSSTLLPEANQVVHPAAAFPVDNNGTVFELPAPTSTNQTTLTGSVIFGIGTQSNNGLGSATVFTLGTNSTDFDEFTTVFPASGGQTLTSSFIDSGSNGIFFPDSAANVPVIQCTDNVFYCPASTQALSAQNLGANGASGTVSFSVDNADTLFSADSSDAVMQNLAGPNGTGTCSGTVGQCTFDWGLPFFFGRNVYTSIDGQAVPSSAPAAPWWAY